MNSVQDRPTMLILRFLGPIQIEAEGQGAITLRSYKALALLGYVAVQTGPTPRSQLLGLLWPDKSEEEARNNLSWALSHINKHLPGSLHTDRLYIALQPSPAVWVDVRHAQALTAEPPTVETLTELSALYRGEFLAGLELSGCAEFELWLTAERERQRQRLWRALDQLTAAHTAAGEYASALETAYRLLALDEWQEDTHRRIMWLLAATGRRAQALEQYARCRALLEEELGLLPAAETEALRRQIEEGVWDAPASPDAERHSRENGSPAAMPPPLPPLPAPDLAGDMGLEAHSTQRSPAFNRFIPVPAGTAIPASPADPDLAILGEKVERAWLHGVLDQAVPPALTLRLDWEFKPQAVARPWTGVIEAGLYDQAPAGETLLELFHSLDRALLILGEAGVGKTITLLQLGRDLLQVARRDPTQPMPVVLNLSTWGEAETTLLDWIMAELTAKYQIPRSLGEAWLEGRRLVLLLDGLDELPAVRQPACVTAINAFRTRYGLIGMVICCRDAVYQRYPQRLHLAGAIQLQPLKAAQIEAYAQAGGADLAAWQAGGRPGRRFLGDVDAVAPHVEPDLPARSRHPPLGRHDLPGREAAGGGAGLRGANVPAARDASDPHPRRDGPRPGLAGARPDQSGAAPLSVRRVTARLAAHPSPALALPAGNPPDHGATGGNSPGLLSNRPSTSFPRHGQPLLRLGGRGVGVVGRPPCR